MSLLSKRRTVVLDTNVALVAANAFDHASESVPMGLKEWCADVLASIMRGECKIALDQDREIIVEYQNKLPDTQLGAAFVKWLYLNMWNSACADHVVIHKLGRSYAEFPNDPKLAHFDASDRKFVAVARAHPHRPHIQEAVDGKWLRWSKTLKRYWVHVDFGDAKYIRSICRKKNKCKGQCSVCDG